MGWIVPADMYDPDHGPGVAPSANIGVRSANDLGQNPLAPAKRSAIVTIESDERIVMSRSERNQQANQRTVEARQSSNRAGAFVARGSSSELVGGSEFGVEVGRAFQTSAKTAPQVTPNSVGMHIRDAKLVKIQPGEGISEEELLSKMTDGEREQYIAEKEASKGDIQSRTPGYIPPPVVTNNMARNNQIGMPSQAQPKARVMVASSSPVVGRVAPTQSKSTEGIMVGVTSSGGEEIFDASGTTGKPVESVIEQEGMIFRNTNGPKTDFGQKPVVAEPQSSMLPGDTAPSQSRIETDGTADYRRMVAKSLCKDFPDDYNFSAHWKKRLAMIRLNYEERSDIIRAIFAAESDDFKKMIIEEFPDAFPS